MNLLSAACRLIIGHEIHTPAPPCGAPAPSPRPAAPICPPTQAVHRERRAAFLQTTADLLAQYQAARGHGLPAIERILAGEKS